MINGRDELDLQVKAFVTTVIENADHIREGAKAELARIESQGSLSSLQIRKTLFAKGLANRLSPTRELQSPHGSPHGSPSSGKNKIEPAVPQSPKSSVMAEVAPPGEPKPKSPLLSNSLLKSQSVLPPTSVAPAPTERVIHAM